MDTVTSLRVDSKTVGESYSCTWWGCEVDIVTSLRVHSKTVVESYSSTR